MKRRVQGVGELARRDGEVPDGVYLVLVKAVHYERNRAKPFYRIEFAVLEPVVSAGKIISGRLYCAKHSGNSAGSCAISATTMTSLIAMNSMTRQCSDCAVWSRSPTR